jgi:hypothetical protein
MRSLCLLCLLAIGISLCAGRSAGAEERPHATIIVLVPGMRSRDVRVVLRALSPAGNYEAGWMVLRAARLADSRLADASGRENLASLALTLGTGARAVADPGLMDSGGCCEWAPVASDLPLKPSTIDALRRANAGLGYPAPIGALGSLFHGAGMPVCALDDDDQPTAHRLALLMAMDSNGGCDGRLWAEATLVAQPDAPWGVAANIERIAGHCQHEAARPGLVVISFGEVDRADRYAPLCLPETAKLHRRRALERLAALIEGLPGNLYVIGLGPAPPGGNRFDRIGLVARRSARPGWLGSPSTRRPDLALDTDLLPTIAASYGWRVPSGLTGRPFRVSATNGRRQAVSPEALVSEHDDLVALAHVQNTLGGLPSIQLLLVGIGAWALATRRPGVLRASAAAIVALPLGMFILPPLLPGSVWYCAPALVLFAAACVALSRPASARGRSWIAGCSLALAVALVVDLVTGSRLLQQAWMSYSVVEGARFYGIGNEYMGAAIGAICILTAAGGERRRNLPALAILLGAMLIVAMGAPSWGAKVGAIPSAGAALGIAALVRTRGGVRGRDVAALALAIALLFGAAALFDLSRAAGSRSHLALALTGGGGSPGQVLARKLAMEGGLLLRSPWSGTLLACCACIVWLRRRMPAVRKCDGVRVAVAGCAAGACVSLALNDAGLLAATLIMLFGWAFVADCAGRQMQISDRETRS